MLLQIIFSKEKSNSIFHIKVDTKSISGEISRYLISNITCDDILEYLKTFKYDFPRLSELTRQTLCI